MSIGTVMPSPKFTAYDNDGAPVAGGKVYFYAAGTDTPQATYTTSALNVANPNPVILDSGGRATIFWSASTYKVKLFSAADVEIWTVDGVASLSALVTAVSSLSVTLKSGSVVAGELVPDATRNDVFYSGVNITSNVRGGGQDSTSRPSWAWSYDARVAGDLLSLLHLPTGGAGSASTFLAIAGADGSMVTPSTLDSVNYRLNTTGTDTWNGSPPSPVSGYVLAGYSQTSIPTIGLLYFNVGADLVIESISIPNTGCWPLTLINIGTHTVTIKHRGSGSAGKVNCSTRADVVLQQYQGGWLYYQGLIAGTLDFAFFPAQ